MPRSGHPARSVISKVSLIMVAISDGSRTLTEITARTGLAMSTVHRLATDLTAWRVLERTPDGSYRAGAPLRALGRTGGDPAACRSCAASVRDRAVPVMEDLLRAVGVRVRVGFLSEELEVEYVQKDSLYNPVTKASAAARLPVHATALGKALLAFSPPAIVEAVLARRMTRYTAYTITDPQLLHAAFRTIRATRLAVCDRELEQESRDVAVPVFGAGGQIAAAIELRTRDLASDITAWRPALTVAAGSLSRELAAHSERREVSRPPFAVVLGGTENRLAVDGSRRRWRLDGASAQNGHPHRRLGLLSHASSET
jgi:IclR family acetate operon transcriptional repressor